MSTLAARRPSPYHLEASGSLKVVGADHQSNYGRLGSLSIGVVAALSCCTGGREGTTRRTSPKVSFHLSRPDGVQGYIGVHDWPLASTTVVSTALASGPRTAAGHLPPLRPVATGSHRGVVLRSMIAQIHTPSTIKLHATAPAGLCVAKTMISPRMKLNTVSPRPSQNFHTDVRYV